MSTTYSQKNKYLTLKNFLGLIIIGVVLVGTQYLFTPSEAEGAWYSTGGTWIARKTITIDATKVSGSSNLTDFPILIDITDSDLQTSAQADGDDILFTSSDGSTKLAHEIELYTTATGRLIAWVKIPTLDYDNDTVIYMYYGNSGASSQQDVSSTWNSGYHGVWHLPNGSSLSVNDSTSNANNGTISSATAVSGKIDGGAGTTGGSSVELPFPSRAYNDSWTMSLWVQVDNSASYNAMVDTASGANRIMFDSSTGAVSYQGGVFGFVNATTNGVTMGSLHHLVIVNNAGFANTFVDGVQKQSGSVVANGMPAVGFSFGRDITGGGSHWQGKFDEIRVSTTNRSTDWILTEYNNQSATSTFYTIGSEEGDTPAVVSSSVGSVKIQSKDQGTQAGWFATGGVWNYRKRISVNPQKVASTTGSNITNFPMLVSVVDPNLKSTGNGGKVGQTDGGDILFTSDNGTTKLSHEIETYTPTTGELVAWVKIPFLSSTSTTPIYMYFGDDDVVDQADATNVWSAYYTGVWHLKETPNTANADSSGSISCTPTAMESGDQIVGKINGSLDLDGSAEYLTCGDNLDFNLADSRTVSLWMNTDDIGGSSSDIGLLTKMNSAFSNGWGLFMSGTSPVLRFVYENSGNETRVDSTASLITVDSGWQHVVATYSNESVAFYIDGVDVGTSAASSGATGNVNNTISLNIAGYADGDEPFNGQFDEVRFATSVLPADWVLTEYRNQSDPSSFYGYGGLETYGGRVNSSNSAAPAVKLRGGVKFR